MCGVLVGLFIVVFEIVVMCGGCWCGMCGVFLCGLFFEVL